MENSEGVGGKTEWADKSAKAMPHNFSIFLEQPYIFFIILLSALRLMYLHPKKEKEDCRLQKERRLILYHIFRVLSIMVSYRYKIKLREHLTKGQKCGIIYM